MLCGTEMWSCSALMSEISGMPLRLSRPKIYNGLILVLFGFAGVVLAFVLRLLLTCPEPELLRTKIFYAVLFTLSVVTELFCVGFALDALRNLLAPPTVVLEKGILTVSGNLSLPVSEIRSLRADDRGVWINEIIRISPDMTPLPPETVKYAIEQRMGGTYNDSV